MLFVESETGIMSIELIIKELGTPCYPPLTQSSSHLTPPDSESQEKPLTDDLQFYGTILCHGFRI